MARKAWGQLSPAYRARLERKGVTPEAHASGVSLVWARGTRTRDDLLGQIVAAKEFLYGERPRWRGPSIDLIDYDPYGDRRSMRQLRAIRDALESEISGEEYEEEFAGDMPSDKEWGFYH